MKILLAFMYSSIVFSQTAPVATESSSSDATKAVQIETAEIKKTETPKSDFLKTAELFGDLRYRSQSIKQGDNQARPIQRLMFRGGHQIQVQDDLKLTYRLMTGTSNNSGNVTLGDAKTPSSPRQTIGLDQAFAKYSPIKSTSVFIGKMPQFFYTAGKNQIILDRDISLEGFGLQNKNTFYKDLIELNLNMGSFIVREKYDDTFAQDLTDSNLNVIQAHVIFKKDDLKLIAAYGIFSFTSIKDDKPSTYLVGATNSKGNTLDILGNYQWQYEMVQNSVELKWSAKPYEAAIFFEDIKNTAADTKNKAQVLGANLGYKKISITYLNQKIESDAVFALLTDSDFSDGQTNSEGSVITVSYKFNDNASLSYSEYKNKQAVDLVSNDYRRTHLDLTFIF